LPSGTNWTRASRQNDKLKLEAKFYRELYQARSSRAFDLAEAGIFSLSVYCGRAIELRMIEDIECLSSELQRSRFGQAQTLLKGHVEVLNSWAIEDSALGISKLAKILLGSLKAGPFGSEQCFS
jgi:hypothetical protein